MYKVSVIIPMYKVEDYLRECLDSVVNQTLKDIEVLCVDDGSPDRSAEIAAEYVEKYSNFKLICKENGGLSSARNAGLDIATGEYVVFLDSDDYIDVNMLKSLYQTASEDCIDVVYFNTALVYENKEAREKHKDLEEYYSRTNDYSGVCTGQTMFARMRKDRKYLPSVCLQIYRRDFLNEHHFRFYPGILHEDNLFTFQCIMTAQKVNYQPDQFYFRRVHDDSITTSSKTIRHVEGYIVSYYEALSFLHGIQLQEDAASLIGDFLYYSFYRNGCNIWNGLSWDEKKKPLRYGGVCAEHLLYVGKKSVEAENHKNRLKQENEKLSKQLLVLRQENEKLIKQNARKTIGGRCKWIGRKIRGFFKCAADHGLGYTLRRAVWKVGHAFAGFMARHTSGLVKGFFQCAADHGHRYTIRRTVWRVGNAFAGVMVRHTSGLAKGFFSCAKENGYRFALKSIVPKCREKLRSHYVKQLMKKGGKHPLVSFILPVYNVEEFLPQCLDTLRQQTMPHIEIICVDDGSTDRSLEILYQYAAKDLRIRVFTQKNQFAGVARNLGLSHAKGEYVVFLDSDDFFAAELAEKAYFAAKMNRADMVLFDAMHYDNSTKEYREAGWLLNKKHIPEKQPFNRNDCYDYLYQMTTPCPWTKMFRRCFVLDEGLQFQPLRNSNDVFFSYAALAMAQRIVTVDLPLVYYRVGLTTNLQATKQRDPFCFFEAYKALHDKLKAIGALDQLRQSYVNVTLSGCLHNWRTQKNPEVKNEIGTALKENILQELALLGYEESFYHVKQNYIDMQRILYNCIIFTDFRQSAEGFNCKVMTTERDEADTLYFAFAPEPITPDQDSIACTLAILCGNTYERIFMDLNISAECKEKIQVFTKADLYSKNSSICPPFERD